MKKLFKIFIMFILMLSLFFFNSSNTEATSTKTAFVNIKSGVLNVRSSASTKAKKIGSLKDGASVVVYSQTKSGWSEIRYKKKKAYVSTKYLKFVDSSKYVFHDTDWGDSINQVKKVTKGNLILKNNDTLLYEIHAFGILSNAYYKFDDNELVSIAIEPILDKKYHTWNEMEFYHDYFYRRIKSDLKTKDNGHSIYDNMEYRNYNLLQTRWHLKSEDVLLRIDNKNDYAKTSILIYYSEA